MQLVPPRISMEQLETSPRRNSARSACWPVMSSHIFLMPFKKSAARSSATASLIRTPRRPRVKRSPRLWKLISSSARDTDRLGRAIGRGLRGGEILALVGPLGAGKTALVRGIALGLGAAPASVSSPTFVLIHEYRGRLPLVHVDLYRVGSHVELESTGLVDYFNGMTIAVIEWADRGRA